MVAYQKQKIENAVCFFAKEHHKKTKKPLYQTFLYKYLAFMDFESVEETGQPALGLKYMAMEKGPVPIEIYEKRDSLETECFKFKKIDANYIIISKGKPNLDFFSPYEIDKMNKLIEIYADRFLTTSDISIASHQSIRAWERAYKIKPNQIIDYELQFKEKLGDKAEKELLPSEKNFLIQNSLDTIGK